MKLTSLLLLDCSLTTSHQARRIRKMDRVLRKNLPQVEWGTSFLRSETNRQKRLSSLQSLVYLSDCVCVCNTHSFQFVNVAFHGVCFTHVAEIRPRLPLVFTDDVVKCRLRCCVRPFCGLFIKGVETELQRVRWLKWSCLQEAEWTLISGEQMNIDWTTVCTVYWPSLDGVDGKFRITLTAASNCLLMSCGDTESDELTWLTSDCPLGKPFTIVFDEHCSAVDADNIAF